MYISCRPGLEPVAERLAPHLVVDGDRANGIGTARGWIGLGIWKREDATTHANFKRSAAVVESYPANLHSESSSINSRITRRTAAGGFRYPFIGRSFSRSHFTTSSASR